MSLAQRQRQVGCARLVSRMEVVMVRRQTKTANEGCEEHGAAVGIRLPCLQTSLYVKTFDHEQSHHLVASIGKACVINANVQQLVVSSFL